MRDTLGNRDPCQAAAAREGRITDTRKSLGQPNARQAVTPVKHTIINSVNTVGDLDACQAITLGKGHATDTRDPFGQNDACQATATVEDVAFDDFKSIGEFNLRKAAASGKRTAFNTRNAVRNRDARQAAASRKYAAVHGNNAVGEREARQTAAIRKRIVTDVCDALRKRHVHKAAASRKGPSSDLSDTGRDRYTRQAVAIPERILTNACDAIGDRDTCKMRATRKTIVINARHAVRQFQMPRNSVAEMRVVHRIFIDRSTIYKAAYNGGCNGIRQLIFCRRYVKRIVVHRLYAMGNADLLQLFQFIESTRSHEGDSLGNIDLLQALGHVGSVSLITAGTKNIAEPGDLVVLEGRANEGHRDLNKVITLGESTDADGEIPCVGIGNGDGGKLVAHKGVRADVNEGLGGGVISAEACVSKGVIVNPLDPARLTNGDLGQLSATVEGEFGDLHDAVGEQDVGQIRTAVERALVDALEVIVLREGNGLETVAHGEGIVVDGHHAGGNMHLCDAVGVVECAVAEGQNIRAFQELDLGELTVLKGTEADDLDPLGHRQGSFPARRHGDQLSAVLGHQQAVHSLVVGVIFSHGECGQIMQTHEGVFAHVAHVFGDMDAFQPRSVERVGHDHQFLAAAEGHGFQLLDLAEGVVTYDRHAVGYGHGGNMGIREGLLGDLGHGETLGKGQRRDAAALEYSPSHGSHGCGDDHATQLFGLLKGRLLDGLDLCVGSKGQAFDGSIGKGGASDEGHALRDKHGRQIGVIERLGLDGLQGLWQHDAPYRAVHKRTAADIDDIAAEVHRSQVNSGCTSVVFDDRDVTALQLGVFPIAVGDHVGHAQIVASRTVIPVLCQMSRQSLGREIEIQILGAEEGKATDEFHGGRDRNLGQIRAVVERVSAQGGNTLGNIDAGQAFAEAEGEIVDVLKLGITEINGYQLAHTLQTVCLDGGQGASLLKSNRFQIGAAVEHVGRNAFELAVLGKGKGGQITASLKRTLGHGGHVGRDTEGRKTAVGEGSVGNTGDPCVLGKGHGPQIPVLGKGVIADLHHAVWNLHGFQRIVPGKSVCFHIGESVGQPVLGNVFTIVESLFPNRHHGCGQIHPDQIPGSVEGGRSNLHNALGNRIIGSSVTGGICHQDRAIRTVNHAVHIRVAGIGVVYENVGQAMASGKSSLSEIGHACRDVHSYQPRTAERVISQNRQTVRQSGGGQLILGCKSRGTNRMQCAAFLKRERREAGIAVSTERTLVNSHDRCGNGKALHSAVIKRIHSDIHQRAVGCEGNGGQTSPVGSGERRHFDGTDARGYFNGGQRRPHESPLRYTRQSRAELCRAQIHTLCKDRTAHGCHAVGNDDTLQRAVYEGISAQALHVGKLHAAQCGTGKGIVSHGLRAFGNHVGSLQACRIAHKGTARGVEKDSVLGGERRIAILNVKGHHGRIAVEGSRVQSRNPGGHGKGTHSGAAREGKVPDADQLTVRAKGQGGKSYVVKERLFPDLGHGVGNGHAHQIGAALKGRHTDALEILGQLDLAQSRLTRKSKLADGRNDLAVDIIGDGDVAAVTRVGADLDGAVLQLHVRIGNAVLLVDPVGVQRQISVKLVLVPHVFLGALRIVVPAVEDGVQALGLGHILKGMLADEHLLGVVQLVGHHVEGNGSPLLQHECAHVQGTVAVIEVGTEITQIVARGVDQFLHGMELGIRGLRQIQG